MCAQTVYAKRVQELKERINRKQPTFQLMYNAFDELCGVKRLSRHNVIWARKKLVEFRDLWIDEDSKRLLDKLALRVEHAAAKWQKRDDERAAAKEAKKGWRFGRPPKTKEVSAPAAPAPNLDPWEE
jgi:hypothetical protein